MKLSKEDAERFPWLLDDRMFSRAGKSLDLFLCPRPGHYSCLCKPKCAICNFGIHSPYHGPLFRQPVGSPPWGHEYARPVTADTIYLFIPVVEAAVRMLPLEIRDDVRQDVLLGLLTDGAPYDLAHTVTKKSAEAWRRLDRHKTLSLDVTKYDDSFITYADELIG